MVVDNNQQSETSRQIWWPLSLPRCWRLFCNGFKDQTTCFRSMCVPSIHHGASLSLRASFWTFCLANQRRCRHHNGVSTTIPGAQLPSGYTTPHSSLAPQTSKSMPWCLHQQNLRTESSGRPWRHWHSPNLQPEGKGHTGDMIMANPNCQDYLVLDLM